MGDSKTVLKKVDVALLLPVLRLFSFLKGYLCSVFGKVFTKVSAFATKAAYLVRPLIFPLFQLLHWRERHTVKCSNALV